MYAYFGTLRNIYIYSCSGEPFDISYSYKLFYQIYFSFFLSPLSLIL